MQSELNKFIFKENGEQRYPNCVSIIWGPWLHYTVIYEQMDRDIMIYINAFQEINKEYIICEAHFPTEKFIIPIIFIL